MYLTTQPGPSRGGGTYLLGAPLSHRSLSGLKRRRLRHLGALTPDQAAEQVLPLAKVGKGAGHNQGIRDGLVSAAQAGYLNAQLPAMCAGGRPPGMAKPVITNTAGGIAMSFVPAAFTAGPIVGGIVLAGAAIAKVFGMIFSHHAAAVKKEQSILCAAVPAANDALQVIDHALSSGQVTPEQAMAAIDNVVAGFQQAVAGIIKGSDPTSSGECNAACVWLSALRAVALVKKSQYQDMALAKAAEVLSPAGVVTSAVSQAASQIGIPPWAVYAAAGLLLFKLL